MKKLIITLLVLLLPTMSFADNQWAWEADGYTTDGSITAGNTVFETDSTNPSALKNLSKQIPIVVQVQSGGGVLQYVDIAAVPCDASNDLVVGFDRTTNETYVCDATEGDWKLEVKEEDDYYRASSNLMATNLEYRHVRFDVATSTELPYETQDPDRYAVAYCHQLVAQGYSDWRLVSYDELYTMIKDHFYNNTFDWGFSSNTTAFYYSTTWNRYGLELKYDAFPDKIQAFNQIALCVRNP